MTLRLWLKKFKLSYSGDVLDIVQFGSSVMEESKSNDVDIAVIFQKIPLSEQLNHAQDIKKQLQKISELPIHIKSFDMYNLFDSSNFAKENILSCGISLISKDFFSKRLGFASKIQISYSLKDLKKKDKIRFNYMLNGKKGKYGLLKKYGGELIRPGLIEVNPLFENIFADAIKKITSKFKAERVFSV